MFHCNIMNFYIPNISFKALSYRLDEAYVNLNSWRDTCGRFMLGGEKCLFCVAHKTLLFPKVC